MTDTVSKLLIVNRGEIALRVVRTAREMGIPTVVVYAEQDRHSQYVKMADEAFLLSGDTYADTYLNEDLLIDILRRSGADAVHPGYGFLSEVPSFADKVIEAGASSMSFWLRRCTEQSRVEYTVKLPCESRPHWVSTCLPWSMKRSTKYSSRSPPCTALWFR